MQKIVSLQILRALAATSVVVVHGYGWLLQSVGLPNPSPGFSSLGGAGVELFFVISGFVMVYTSEPMFGRPDGPKIFALHRLIRIVPLYWLVTALYIAASLAFPSFDKHYGLDFIVASLLFIPMENSLGAVMPIIGQGWTLNYEMLFYAVFALAVFAPRRLAVALASAVLITGVMYGSRLAPSSTAVAFWTSPIVYLFIYGMVIGLLYREGLRLWKPLCLALIAAGVTFTWHDAVVDPALRLLPNGVPPALLVAGATFGRFTLEGSLWRLLARIGDASYAIYLLHAFPIRGALALSYRMPFGVTEAPWFYAGLALIGATVLGLVTYYLLERPMTRYLRGLLAPRKQAQAVPHGAFAAVPLRSETARNEAREPTG
ncbi:MAG: acyltransferase [Xanthobacteraceae bacterium]